jgi:uncharacterized protein (TIGR00730 family)
MPTIEAPIKKRLTEEEFAKKIHSEIERTIQKLSDEDPGILNLKITEAVLKDLRYSFKIFNKFKKRRKITIFGSARTPKTHPAYKMAYNFAAHAAEKKYMIITGGGPGIMAAGNAGAAEHSFGLNIRLPYEQQPNEFVQQSDTMIHYKYFFIRKLFLLKEADACVFFPGGFGTLDEAFEVLTLVQTGKAKIVPLIFVDTPRGNFWKPVLTFLEKNMAKAGYISSDDHKLYSLATSVSDAFKTIDTFYKNFHSIRFHRKEMLVRVRRTPTLKQLAQLNQKFGYLAADKTWTIAPAQMHEHNEPEISKLPRLRCRFEKRDFGGVREMIDLINTW